MYTSTNAFEAGSHEVIYEPKIKKPSTFTTPLQIEIPIESSRPLPTCGKNREGPISKFRLTNIHADNPKFSFYQLKPNQSSDVSHIIS